MNRARPSSRHKQTACSGCHLIGDHSTATTRGVGVISPTRAVIRGTPSPLWSHYTGNPSLQEMICSTIAPSGLTTGTRKVGRAQVHCGNREGNLVVSETARSVWLIWFVLSIWFIWFIRLVWFNQINKTNQINQITVFLHWRTISAFG